MCAEFAPEAVRLDPAAVALPREGVPVTSQSASRQGQATRVAAILLPLLMAALPSGAEQGQGPAAASRALQARLPLWIEHAQLRRLVLGREPETIWQVRHLGRVAYRVRPLAQTDEALDRLYDERGQLLCAGGSDCAQTAGESGAGLAGLTVWQTPPMATGPLPAGLRGLMRPRLVASTD